VGKSVSKQGAIAMLNQSLIIRKKREKVKAKKEKKDHFVINH
jgi:hypothetical protein